GRRNMIRRYRVAEDCQYSSPRNVRQRRRLPFHVFKERRTLYICRCVVPLEQFAGWSFDLLPPVVTSERLFISSPEHLWLDRGTDGVADFGLCRPDVAQVNRRSLLIDTERFGLKINVHLPRERIRHDQW